MANPQVENGHVRIANELYDAALLRLSPTEFKVWAAIVRYTYGWNRKEAPVTYESLSEAVGICKRSIIAVCRNLEERNVIVCTRQMGKATVVGPNKDYDQWLDGAVYGVKNPSPVSKPSPVSPTSPHPCRNLHPTREGFITPPVKVSSPPCNKGITTNLKTVQSHGADCPRILRKWTQIFRPLSNPNPNEIRAANAMIVSLDDWDEDRAIAYLIAWYDNRWEDWRKANPSQNAPGLPWFKEKFRQYFSDGILPGPNQSAKKPEPAPVQEIKYGHGFASEEEFQAACELYDEAVELGMSDGQAKTYAKDRARLDAKMIEQASRTKVSAA